MTTLFQRCMLIDEYEGEHAREVERNRITSLAICSIADSLEYIAQMIDGGKPSMLNLDLQSIAQSLIRR